MVYSDCFVRYGGVSVGQRIGTMRFCWQNVDDGEREVITVIECDGRIALCNVQDQRRKGDCAMVFVESE